MIDLSYLTEEEQGLILDVLKRDAELKKAEEERVKNLQKSEHDKGRLKYLTGEWFYETKSQRHRDRIHGADLIRASMKHRQKPVTILEFSQMVSEKPGFVNSDNRDVFVPAELCGLIEEPHTQRSNKREEVFQSSQDTQKPVLQSPTKQRQNPFNSASLAPQTLESLEESDGQLSNGIIEQTKTPMWESLPPPECCIANLTNVKQESPPNSPVTHNALLPTLVPIPVPRKKTNPFQSHHSLVDIDRPTGRQSNPPAPRGILKHSSICSSTDSLYSHLASSCQPDLQSPIFPESPTDINPVQGREDNGYIDRKQVRFCSAVEQSSLDWPVQDGKELGEHCLLDLDSMAPSEGADPIATSNSRIDSSEGHLIFSSKEENETVPVVGSFACQQHSLQVSIPIGQIPQVNDREVEIDGDSMSCRKGPHLQSHDAGQPQIPIDKHVHGHAETLSPQVSNINLAEQGSGKAVLLETDKEEDGHSMTKVRDGYGWRHRNSNEIRSDLAVETSDEMKILNNVTDSNPSSDPVSKTTSLLSPGSQKEILGIFSRGESKVSNHPETQILVQEYPIQSILISQSTVNKVEEKRHVTFKQDVSTPDKPEVRTLQLTALQNTTFKDTFTSISLDSDKASNKITVKDGDETYPKKLSNLKSFWERENSGPRVIFAKPSASAKSSETPEINLCIVDHERHDCDDALTNTTIAEDSQNLQKSGIDPDSYVCPPKTEEESPDKNISSLSNLDFSQEEGTYRARPILICEEIDNSFEGVNTFSETSLLLEPVTSLSITPSSIMLSQQDPQENKATKINDLKSFWEKEYSGPKIFIGGAKEALSSQTYQRADQCSVDIARKLTTSKSNPITSTIRKDSVDHELKSSSLGSSDSAVLTETDISQKCFVRSPSKTCHPKALPKESSKLDGSPLKTFSIDINPSRLDCEDKCERPMLAIGQRRRPSHEAKQSGSSVMKISTEITLSPPKSSPEGPSQHCHTLPQSSSKQSPLDVSLFLQDTTQSPLRPIRMIHLGTSLNVEQCSPSPSSKSQQPQHQPLSKASEAVHFVPQCANIDDGEKRFADVSDESETCPRLARSFIPQNNEHYLGVAERAYVPHFYKGKTKESDVISSAPLTFLDEKQKHHSNEGSSFRTHAGSVNNADNSKQDSKTMAFSQHGGSSDSYQVSNPVQLARTQLSSKLQSSSKSMENLTSQPKSKIMEKSQRGQLNLSVDDVTELHPMPHFLTDSKERENMSMTVPVLLLDETYGRDSDCISEDSLHMDWRGKTGSTSSNLSLTSGNATMSSVGSVMSINTSEFGDLEVQGTIQFAMNYVQKLGEFHIFVVLCRDLAIAEPKKHRSDPYVKCYLLPDNTKMGKRKTSVKKKTTNPTYNEILRFKVTMENLKTQKLNLSVWHNDNFGRNSFLGEVDLDLSEWDFNNTDINDYALKARISTASQSPCHSPCVNHRSEMRVAVRFLPQISYSKRTSETGEVQIWVKDCKNLAPVRGVIIDPFVKCTVLPDTSRKSRQKTRVVKRTANPMFNHTMVYDGFRQEDLKEACMEITVWDHDRVNNHLIGGIRLGLGTGKSYGAKVEWMDSTLDEASLWEKMMQSHSEWVEDVLPLRIFVMARNMST